MNLEKDINDIVGALVNSIEDTNKEYLNEKISSSIKHEQLNVITDIAKFRLNSLIRACKTGIIVKLKEERFNSNQLEAIKNTLDEQL